MNDPQKIAKTLDALLQQANGSRQTVMSRDTIATLLCLVAGKEKMLWARSHETNSGYGDSSSATFAFCARTSANELSIAIKLGPAKNGTPGRAWSDLKPWRPGTRTTNDKINRWLENPTEDQVRFSLSMAGSVAAAVIKLPPVKVRWRKGVSSDENEIFAVEHGNPKVQM
jgi:hypothetical protein